MDLKGLDCSPQISARKSNKLSNTYFNVMMSHCREITFK